MTVTVEIPESVAQALASQNGDLPRAVLEAIALEGYRTDRLSEYEIQQLLGFETRMEVHGFFKQHDIYLNYGLDDLKHDIRESERHSILKAAEPSSKQHVG